MFNKRPVLKKRTAFKLFTVTLLLSSIGLSLLAQNAKPLDATKISKDNFNSIVKIILFDSLGEKRIPGTGAFGRGSGFIVSEDGYIFTNRHVIDPCMLYMRYTYYDPADQKIHTQVDKYNPSALNDVTYHSINYITKTNPIVQIFSDEFGNYQLYTAKVVAIDTLNFDGAILKIMTHIDGSAVTEKFKPVEIGNSDKLFQGEDLCVFGFPAQYDGGIDLMLKDQSTLTFGKNSGFDFVVNSHYGLIKTDAAINAGNSGGPVFGPNNKVIGLATASFEKTNTGLLGGINGMYHLAALVPELFKTLLENGLTEPGRKLPQKSVTLFESNNYLIPPRKAVRRSNDYKETVRRITGGSFYVKGYLPLNYSMERTINGPAPAGDQIAKGSLNVKTNPLIELEGGRLFTLKSYSAKRKLYLDYTFLHVSYAMVDWSKSNVSIAAGSPYINAYYNNVPTLHLSTGLGLNYALLTLRKFPVSAFYKLMLRLQPSSEIIGTAVQNQNPYRYAENINLQHQVGFQLRYKEVALGLEYHYTPITAQYSMWYANYQNIIFTGNTVESSLNLTLCISIGGKENWKKVINQQYKPN